MIVVFVSVAGFLVYRYHTNQVRYLQTVTRSIYDTLQRSSDTNPGCFLRTASTNEERFDHASTAGSHHSQYAVAYVYK